MIVTDASVVVKWLLAKVGAALQRMS